MTFHLHNMCYSYFECVFLCWLLNISNHEFWKYMVQAIIGNFQITVTNFWPIKALHFLWPIRRLCALFNYNNFRLLEVGCFSGYSFECGQKRLALCNNNYNYHYSLLCVLESYLEPLWVIVIVIVVFSWRTIILLLLSSKIYHII